MKSDLGLDPTLQDVGLEAIFKKRLTGGGKSGVPNAGMWALHLVPHQQHGLVMHMMKKEPGDES